MNKTLSDFSRDAITWAHEAEILKLQTQLSAGGGGLPIAWAVGDATPSFVDKMSEEAAEALQEETIEIMTNHYEELRMDSAKGYKKYDGPEIFLKLIGKL